MWFGGELVGSGVPVRLLPLSFKAVEVTVLEGAVKGDWASGVIKRRKL